MGEDMNIDELLGEPLNPKHVAKRKQGNAQVSYIESHHAIREANRIFGYFEWDSETKESHLVQAEEKTSDSGLRWYVGYITKVRVIARNGERVAYRDGTGFGQGIDKDLGKAHESAVKEAESDAQKRALKNFGDQFGLALYDKNQEHVADKKPAVKPREGGADPNAPFGWRLKEIPVGDWQIKIPTDKTYKAWTDQASHAGIAVEHRAAFISFLCNAYGIGPDLATKQAGYWVGIEFLKDAPEDIKEDAIEGFMQIQENK